MDMMNRRTLLAMSAASLFGDTNTGRQPQLTRTAKRLYMAYGDGARTVVKVSDDEGGKWTEASVFSAKGKMALGMRRGPRIAVVQDKAVVSFISEGDLWAMNGGAAVRVNDVADSAREGLHAMASGGGKVYATWLDLRSKGTTLCGSVSSDGGNSWSKNEVLYTSPDGSICQCCHPTVAVDGAGKASVMFRNAVGGMRDMYAMEWGGKAAKLGSGSWKLNACPMDGGGMAFDLSGKLVTVWRRDTQVFVARPGSDEELLGTGKQPVVAVTAKGVWVAWNEAKSIVVRNPAKQVEKLGEGSFPSIVGLASGGVLLGWENEGQISLKAVGA